MKDVELLLQELKKVNAKISVDGEDLRIDLPKGQIDEQFKLSLKKHKKDILEYIHQIQNNSFCIIPEVDRNDQSLYSLSSSQLRLWLISQIEEGNIAYNLYGVYTFNGTVSIKALELSFASLIERHESLRTVFREDAEDIKQFIKKADEYNFKIDYQDFTKIPDSELQVRDSVQKEVSTPFDLTDGPLLRASLMQVTKDKYVFVYVMHHIITDGWSMDILINELMVLYNAYNVGKNNPLVPLRIQYKDYASWQQSELNESLGAHRKFWREQFEGHLPVLELPSDKPRPPIKTYNGEKISRMIGKRLSNRLKGLVDQQGATLFMGLLATTSVLLYRYTNQNDIIVGTPVAGRGHLDLENQIGFYVNTLALRMRIENNASFDGLLNHIKLLTANAFEHQIYPFDELIRDLNLHGDQSRHPLFDVMVVLQNTGSNTSGVVHKFGDIEVNEYEGIRNPTSKFDLLFNFIEGEDEIKVGIQYNSDIYKKEGIERIACHFENLLSNVIDYPSIPLSQLEYLDAEEKHQLLVKFNNTGTDYPLDKTVINLFEEQVERTPDRIALVFEDKVFTYRQLNAKSNQLARYIRHRGVTKGVSVGVLLDRCEWSVISMIAVMKLGCIYVPIEKSLPVSRMRYMLEESDALALITDISDHAIFGEIDNVSFIKTNIAFGEQLEAIDQSNISTPISVRDSSFIIYTSGSTGSPKGVEQTHLTLLNLILWSINGVQLTKAKRHLQFGSFSFDSSLHDIYYTISTGGEVHVISENVRRDLWGLKDYILNKAINIVSMPYAALKTLFTEIPLEEFKHHEVTDIISVGEQLYVNGGLRKFLKDNSFVKIHNFYGPSETHAATWITYSFSEGEIQEKASIGKPIHNSFIYILDECRQLVPIGIEGEIYIGGWNLASGYANREDLTSEKFLDDPFRKKGKIYRSGDIGKWLPNGEIEYIRRIDDQVKIRGYRIETGEIENALQQNDQIEDAVVMVKKMGGDDQELVAYIVSKEKLDTANIRAYLSKTLPAYMLPSYYIYIDQLPLTSNGKVNKKALPIPNDLDTETAIEYIAPRNEIEAMLVSLWHEVIGKQRIGVKDNFFEVGGNSLKAMKLQGILRRKKGITIRIQDIYNQPTIEDMVLNQLKYRDILLLNKWNYKNRKNIYFIPPLFGSSAIYKKLSEKFDNDFNCFGLQFKGFQKNELYSSVEEIAKDFSDQIIRQQSEGEFILFGYSMGAVIAFETAKILELHFGSLHLVLIERGVSVKASKPNFLKKALIELKREVFILQTFFGFNVNTKLKHYRHYMRNNVKVSKGYKPTGQIKSDIHGFEALHEKHKSNMTEWRKHTTGQVHVNFIHGVHSEGLLEVNLRQYAKYIKSIFN